MHKVAKFPIYPGIHSMANLQFIMNKKKWNKLSKDNQTALDVWYIAAYTEMRIAADVEDNVQVAKDKAGGEITVVDWVQEERDKFRKIAVNAWENFAKKSPLAREALNSQLSFMKKMGML
jgi:TRAP-type mannitol/chloroaromatic compound transport system substrate-binding protein